MSDDNPFGIDPDSRDLWWRSQTGLGELLELLDLDEYGRKVRLFLVACARRVEHLMPGPHCRAAVRVSEEYAEGRRDDAAVAVAAWNAAGELPPEGSNRGASAARGAAWALVARPQLTLHERAAWVLREAALAIERVGAPGPEPKAQTAILRCVFGNPFRPVAFAPSWRTSTVEQLSHTMYGSRDFGGMPVLADALQEAGCDNDDILSHCRGDGPHVRGCWVVDLVLGKA